MRPPARLIPDPKASRTKTSDQHGPPPPPTPPHLLQPLMQREKILWAHLKSSAPSPIRGVRPVSLCPATHHGKPQRRELANPSFSAASLFISESGRRESPAEKTGKFSRAFPKAPPRDF